MGADIDETFEATQINLSVVDEAALGTRSAGAQSIAIKVMRENLERFINQAGYIIDRAASRASQSGDVFEVSEFKVSAAIESSGQISLLGGQASVGVAGTIEITFKRK